MDDPLLSDEARRLIADLTARRQTVATAESLTAGLLAATLAGVPGASAVLLGRHPVGTVFLGLAGPSESSADIRVSELRLSGSRWDIRRAAVQEAVAALHGLVAAT